MHVLYFPITAMMMQIALSMTSGTSVEPPSGDLFLLSKFLAVLLKLVNHSTNFVLYSVSGKAFRAELKAMLSALFSFCKCPEDKPTGQAYVDAKVSIVLVIGPELHYLYVE